MPETLIKTKHCAANMRIMKYFVRGQNSNIEEIFEQNIFVERIYYNYNYNIITANYFFKVKLSCRFFKLTLNALIDLYRKINGFI